MVNRLVKNNFWRAWLLWLLLSGLLSACGSGEATPGAVISPVSSGGTTAPVIAISPVQSPPTAPVPTTTAPTLASVTPLPPTPTPVPTAAPPTSLAATPLPATAVPVTVSPTTPAVKIDFSGDLAMTHVQMLAGTIGIRAAGTAGDRQAGDYIESYFKSLGLTTERPMVNFTITRDNGSSVSYQAGGAAVTLKGSAMTLSGKGQLKGQLVSAGTALPNSLNGLDLSGKIALVQRGQSTFQSKVDTVTARGASAILIYNNQDGPLDSATLQNQAPLPVLGLSKADGEKLLSLLNAGSALTINVTANLITSDINFTNVVATRPGANNNAPIIIFGGHYDSVPAGPGANDNASGTAVTMELARVLQNRYPAYEFRFVGFSGEEIGLVGSTDYARKLSEAERKRIVAMINIDMVTVGPHFYVGGTANLTKIGLAEATNLGAGNVEVIPADLSGASDHYAFQQLGIPVLFFNRESDPDYHKPGDTADHVKPDRLSQVGQIVINVIDKLSRN